MMPPPRAPVCNVGVCDPINLKCACVESGAAVVKEYNIEVKHANTNKWMPYRICGLDGGDALDCEISHEWLAANAGAVEGSTVVFRVSAFNQYGWGATSKDLTTKFLSKPK